MEALLNRYRNLTVLLVAIFAQLILLGYQVKTNQDVRLLRVWAVTAITPFANAVEVVRQNTIGIAENYFVLVNVRDQNRKLNDELGHLKLENNFLKNELQTADRARLLSVFQQRTQSRTLAARIIGNATGTNSRVVFVDRGSTSGVMRGMAVLTPDGIVGKVISAYPTASQVQLVTDENFAAGVISEKHRVHGTFKGKGENKPIVDYVQNEEQVDPGELFYTSGDDRVFPKGMPVGAATVVRRGKTFKEIYIVPGAFQRGGVEEVLIVLEGVHQAIPDHNAVASNDISLLPAPPSDEKSASVTGRDLRSGLTTEADKIRERYKKIGEIEHHTYGEGVPGSKPPDFNINPDDPKLRAQPGVPSGQPSAQTPGTAPPSPAAGAPKPSAAKPASTTAAAQPGSAVQPAPAKPKPLVTSGSVATGTATGTPVAPVKPRTTTAGSPGSAQSSPAAVKPAQPAAGFQASPGPSDASGSRNRVTAPQPSQPAKPKPAPPRNTRPNDDGAVEVLPIP